MAIPLGLKVAIATVLFPGVVSNIWQAVAGPALGALTRRLWPYLLASVLGTLLGVSILSIATQDVLLTILGVILVAYSIFSLSSPQFTPPGEMEKFFGPTAGGFAVCLMPRPECFWCPA
ncbi:MAG: sulfite exporter TauE/SafE family protein [Rhizobiaceae bacterium]